MNLEIKQIAENFKQLLCNHYGERLQRLILFGSYARNDFHDESDVDLMIVLNDIQVHHGLEIRALSKVVSDLSLKFGKSISILPVSKNRFETSSLPFYTAVRREGIEL
ncbi:MAG: nucleotidyltransferase domain-containing protein [Runella slithyformis]|nr:MAG: nucleotidyltransferase domain-containing protein [Runella slithyformis]